MEATDVTRFLGFGIDEAARVTGASRGQIARWNRSGLVEPRLSNEEGEMGRIYSFRDLVGLRTLARLRSLGISMRELRRFNDWLRARYDEPWSSLRFQVVGQELVFVEPETGAVLAANLPGQRVILFDLQAEEADMLSEVRKLRERRPDQVGQVAKKNRHFLGGRARLDGTRVPTSAVYSLAEDGCSTEEILEAYPGLEAADIPAAIDYERAQALRRAEKAAARKRRVS